MTTPTRSITVNLPAHIHESLAEMAGRCGMFGSVENYAARLIALALFNELLAERRFHHGQAHEQAPFEGRKA
jgi:hypothetical protein